LHVSPIGGRKAIFNVTPVATKKKISSFEGEVGTRILGGAGWASTTCPRTVKIACFFFWGLFVNDIVCANFESKY
jgi:hypothetical protein